MTPSEQIAAIVKRCDATREEFEKIITQIYGDEYVDLEVDETGEYCSLIPEVSHKVFQEAYNLHTPAMRQMVRDIQELRQALTRAVSCLKGDSNYNLDIEEILETTKHYENLNTN